jgi:hypothetical protein
MAHLTSAGCLLNISKQIVNMAERLEFMKEKSLIGYGNTLHYLVVE